MVYWVNMNVKTVGERDMIPPLWSVQFPLHVTDRYNHNLISTLKPHTQSNYDLIRGQLASYPPCFKGKVCKFVGCVCDHTINMWHLLPCPVTLKVGIGVREWTLQAILV